MSEVARRSQSCELDLAGLEDPHTEPSPVSWRPDDDDKPLMLGKRASKTMEGRRAMSLETPKQTSELIMVSHLVADLETQCMDDSDTDLRSQRRPRWRSRADYLVTCFGFVIGLPTVWRFPYVCYENGGGTFVFAFLVSSIVVGIPMYQLELSLGQMLQTSFLKLWPYCSKRLVGLGFSSLILAGVAASYFAVITSWAIYYFFECWRSAPTSPWPIKLDTDPRHVHDSAARYFVDDVLRKSTGFWDVSITSTNGGLLACLFLVWAVVTLASLGSVTRTGLISAFSALFPLLGLTALSLFSFTLPGATIGLQYFLIPSPRQLLSLRLWCRALLQVFFTFGIGWGSLVNFGSFSHPRNDFVKDAVIVMCMGLTTSLLAGFATFCVMGHFLSYYSNSPDISIDQVVQTGSGLLFVAYPSLFHARPMVLIGFFILIIALGLSSILTMLNLIKTFLLECEISRRYHPHTVVSVVCGALLLIGMPMTFPNGVYLVELLDGSTGSLALFIIPSLEVLLMSRFDAYHRRVFSWRRAPVSGVYWAGRSILKSLFPLVLVLMTWGAILDFGSTRTTSISSFRGCSNNCGHGYCVSNHERCVCDKGWSGLDCSVEIPKSSKWCPDNCNGKGECDLNLGKCMCLAEFEGDACEIDRFERDQPFGARLIGWLVAAGSLCPGIIIAFLPEAQNALLKEIDQKGTLELLRDEDEDLAEFPF